METTRMIPPGGDDNERTRAIGPQDQAYRTQMIGNQGQQTQMAYSQQALSMECIPGNKYALSTESSRDHMLVKIAAGESAMGMGQRLPVNLCLIIDRSGSMEGEPLDYVKRACSYVVDLLEPNDILSIVTFEEKVEVVMPARRVVNRALVKEHINRIEPGNTTNIYDGIAVGAGQVASVKAEGYVSRAMLFTDGEPTAGPKDFHSIVGMVAEQKSRGVTVTALGFGSEYNEELLAGIARRSGGNYYYITRPDLIPEVFRKELETLMTVVARNLQMRVNMSRWVQVRQIYGKQPSYGNRTAEVPMEEMERGSVQSALVEIELGQRPAGQYRIAKVELEYDDAVTQRRERVVRDVIYDFTPDRNLVQANVNPVVQRELEVALASRNLERTVMGMRTQQISPTVAINELQRTQSLLIQQGKTLQAQEIQQAINDIQQGASAEKTLVGTILNLDRGREK